MAASGFEPRRQLVMLRNALIAAIVFVASAIAADAAMNERDFSVKTPTGTLWGTLASATTPSPPAVLMLAGSGPTDRNGNAMGIHPDTLKLLAQGLAPQGITSLRIDKRGIGESAPAMSSEADLRFQTYVDDAKSWARALKAEAGANCVWLLGHSEGALIAELAAQNNADICGLILISGVGRKAGAVIREQLDAMPGMAPELKSSAFAALSELEAGRAVAAPPPQLMALFRPSVQPYLMSWLPLDPAAILTQTHMPVLIVQGDSDIQVSVADAKLLAAARPDAKLLMLPGMNHVLKIAPADRAGNIATYADPALPLAPGLVDALAEFIRAAPPSN